MTSARICPDCGTDRLANLGPLPSVSFFAGLVSDRPLPGGELFRCHVCDLRFRWPLLPDYAALYDNAGVESWSAGSLRHDQRLVMQLLETIPGACKVLDFGCYTGGFLANSTPASIASASRSHKGRQDRPRACGCARVTALDEFPDELTFDAIVSMDVVEHVASPRALLQHLHRRLKPNGRLAFSTGDGSSLLWRLVASRWWYCYFPEHIAFISPRWLRFHAPRLGFTIASVQRFNYLQGHAETAPGWSAWIKYLLRPGRHAAKRAGHLARHGSDMGVPGIGLTRDHLLVQLAR